MVICGSLWHNKTTSRQLQQTTISAVLDASLMSFSNHLCLIWCGIFDVSVVKLLTKEVKVKSFFCSHRVHLGKQTAQKQTMLQGCKLQISQFFQILTDLGCDGVRSYAPIVAGWFLRLVWNNEWRYLPIGNIKNNGGEYSWKYCILVLEKCSLLVVSEESNCCIHWGLNAQPSVVHQFSLHLRCEWSLTSASALSWNLWQKQHPPPSGMERKALPLHLFQCHLNWSKILAQQ